MFKTVKFIIIFIIILFIAAGAAYWRGINASVEKAGQDVIFTVPHGESVEQISQNLYDANLIKSKFYFKIYVWRKKQQANLQAGEYVLNSNLSIKEIVNVLVAGQSLSKEKTIKIIEGWNMRDINGYLEEKNIIMDDSFIELAKKGIMNHKLGIMESEFLNNIPAGVSLEGYLFPDTYKIFNDAAAEDIIEKMLFNFDKKLTDEMRAEIANQGKTIHQIITMASVVEKEIRIFKDMKIVSGIFWDRIKHGQALESCATLAYILGVNKPRYSIEDTKINSPYNTYQNQGLPPGPICNPGINAIKAAIYPEFTNYNYFLNRQDTKKGETIFSKTLDEHNRNKAKYLK